ncbi:MAG: hypothetical protein GY703_09565 [Gammaproteobacteria bacterium]|nr:hypothetical protein [Gammaproteobacteria bacterium]
MSRQKAQTQTENARAVIYMPPALHEKLKRLAKQERRSISGQTVKLLEEVIGNELATDHQSSIY